MRTVTVRARQDSDVDALVAILAETHERDSYPMRASNVAPSFLVDAGFEAAWVATVDEVVVGHIAVHSGIDQRDVSAALDLTPDRILGITRLFVGSAARGLGAAQRLMDVADQYAATNDFGLALDVVDGSTAAIALYEGRGWKRVATENAEWSAPDGSHPVVHFYVTPVDKSDA
jgi:ribosomal protein S18 acetylase RimI-like enzyme